VDADTGTRGLPVLNRTVTLKESVSTKAVVGKKR
jgi:hypothetical protein